MKKTLAVILLIFLLISTNCYANSDECTYECTLKSIECLENGVPGCNGNVGKEWTIEISNDDTFKFKTEDIGADDIGASEIPSLGNILENDFVQQVNSLDFTFTASENGDKYPDTTTINKTLIEHDNIIELKVYETKDGETICENIKPCIWQIIINIELIDNETPTPVETTEPTETPVETTEPTETPIETDEPTETPVVTIEPTETPDATTITVTPVTTELPQTGEGSILIILGCGILLIVVGIILYWKFK